MRSADGANEVSDQLFKRQLERGTSSDQHIIRTQAQTLGCDKSYDLAQATAHAIALDRPSNLLRHREADSRRTAIAAITGLQYKAPPRHLGAAGSRQEIGP
jgi:hypothetical protein